MRASEIISLLEDRYAELSSLAYEDNAEIPRWKYMGAKEEIIRTISLIRCHIFEDGRAKASKFCADCKDEFGHPDSCINCPNDPL